MRAVLALLRAEMLRRRAYPLQILGLTLSPFLVVGPFVFVGTMFPDPKVRTSVAVGTILWYWLSMLFWGVGFGIREEMEEGVFESIAATPARLQSLLAAKALDVLAGNIYLTVCTFALLRWTANVTVAVPWSRIVPVVMAAAFALSALAVAYAALVLATRQASGIGSMTQQALGALSGMTAPVSTLPRAARWASAAVPLTYAIQGARAALEGRWPWSEIAVLAAFGTGMLVVGLAVFAHAERRARTTGTLGEY
ncbi:MAG: ABC transporter permease [Actinomycetota bacterium]